MSINIPTMNEGEMEPSLDQLIDWFKRVGEEMNIDDHIEANEMAVLNEYKTNSMSTWASGKYYLYGQIPIDTNTPITPELLQSAIDANSRRYVEYGGPCNSFEAASIAKSDDQFKNFMKLLDFYHNKYNEIAYAPGGNGYKLAEKSWNSRNKDC
jgi:hypothetical protein